MIPWSVKKQNDLQGGEKKCMLDLQKQEPEAAQSMQLQHLLYHKSQLRHLCEGLHKQLEFHLCLDNESQSEHE